MKAHPTTNTDWLLQMAAAENNADLSVGGLARELGMFGQQPESAESASIPPKGAFSRLIGLRRREQRLTVEQLAERADVELVELLDIEHGTLPAPPDVRTVYKLATTLKLPEQPLMQLAGLAQPKDDAFGEAAVRFAARSEPVDKLSREEHQALEEFVKFLAKK